MDYKKISNQKEILKKQKERFWNYYDDEESMANDLLDMAIAIIGKQNLIIKEYEKTDAKYINSEA